jgi:hypothetical protein
MLLKIFDTNLGTQGMEDICELGNCSISFLSRCGLFCIQVVITSDKVVLFLNNIYEGFLGDRDCK